jgi:hypothetical protein
MPLHKIKKERLSCVHERFEPINVLANREKSFHDLSDKPLT